MGNEKFPPSYDRFKIAHRDYARVQFEEFAIQQGFVRRRKDFFIRPAEDGIIHAFCPRVTIDSRYKILRLQPTLVVCHKAICEIMSEVKDANSKYEMRGKRDPYQDWVTVGVVKFVLAFEQGIGAISDYTVDYLSALDSSVAEALEDTKRAIPLFLTRQKNLQELVSFLRAHDWAGGTARWMYLMASLHVSGRSDELEELIDFLKERPVAPMTK